MKTAYCVEIKHDGYGCLVTFDTMNEVIDFLKRISYLSIGMTVEISTFQKNDE